MPPRAPVVWTSAPARGERMRRRLDERHRDLSTEARTTAARYRSSRAARTSPELQSLRADFLAALGRLSAFESASQTLSGCRYQLQMRAYADDLSRDYFELWALLARRGAEPRDENERGSERIDYFAVQIGRLEGMADALVIAGRNVRLFPLPNMPWVSVT